MGFFRAFKDAVLDTEQKGYAVEGRQVACSHCGGTHFEKSEALLNTAGLTFLDLDWANRSATILICDNCGHIEWFLNDEVDEL